MDPLSDVIRTLVLTGSLLARSRLGGAWDLIFDGLRAPMFHFVTRGSALLTVGQGERLRLRAGDIVVLTRPAPHRLAAKSGTRGERVIDFMRKNWTAERCANLQRGRPSTEMLCGFFRSDQGDVHPLLTTLPPVVHLETRPGARHHALSPLLEALAHEAADRGSGSASKIERLMGALLVDIVRASADLDVGGESWLRALADPQLITAIQAIHDAPNKKWRVDRLAATASMSRTAFVARFTRLVGRSPIRYLTDWRIHRAAYYLRCEGRSIGEVCALVGYDSESTFSRAFSRRVGMSPGAYRRCASRPETALPE